MPELSENNRVCAYDRAGYGWSEAADDGRSPQDAADDLAALLSAAQIEPPYVLVAFSHAGLAGRLFAAQHTDQMAGMVLIDPATEFDNEIMGAELMQQQAAAGMFKGFGFMAKIGLLLHQLYVVGGPGKDDPGCAWNCYQCTPLPGQSVIFARIV